MTFDKSKVCVAGLHEVPIGTKGYYSDELQNLEIYVLTDHKTMLGKCAGFNCNISKYEIIASDMSWRFFYPLPEKKYRPYETVEEVSGLLGNIIVTKDGSKICVVTSVENRIATLFINNMTTTCAFDNYTMEDGTPVGVPE